MSLWLDAPDAEAKLAAMNLDAFSSQAILALIRDGVAVLKGVNDGAMCDALIADYQTWCAENDSYVQENLDVLGRPKRLVNFHTHSPNARAISMNEKVHRILDVIFQDRAAVYTSLTFKFGTQQPVHRDTPHFATWPEAHFIGVWNALEDVHADAGPLFYHKGAHRMPIKAPAEFLEEATRRAPDMPLQERLLVALDLYNGEVIRNAPVFSQPETLPVSKGDVVLWHPEMPHGGSPANDQMRSRWSMVCHCAPEKVQVHQHDRFFQHAGPAAPPDRYGYTDMYPRKIALAGGISFM